MVDTPLTNSRIVTEYRNRTPKSAELASTASDVFPSGITHDSRHMAPYGVYIDKARGSRKWDVDGNEYIDYYGGHGALLLGHGHPEVVKAVQDQMERGTQYGACHDLEVQWGELVRKMVPSAETVRFTSSGTEADLMALRLARAFTGKSKIVRFLGHFHGWSDHMAFGVTDHFDGSPTPGLVAEIASNTLLAPAGDIAELERVIDADGDVAAVILEPTGASGGQIPLDRAFHKALRALTEERGIVLIFDEVVTGFRVSRGGAQEHFGVMPDLTALAKILAGGLPGGAICGRADIMELLDFDAADAKGFEKIGHQGTYNANPLSAAAGVAALSLIKDGDACAQANKLCGELMRLLNEVIADEGLSWACHGDFSCFYLFLNPQGLPIGPNEFDAGRYGPDVFKAKSTVANKLRLALLLNGVDISGKPGGLVSATHTQADIEATADALRTSIAMLREEEDLE
ncbi:MAG: aspartate aminotransferase family protein, partial [Hyphomicrobiaceae bacterium]|nr:aspartate aminotransferase family protein [Hyphomicrobiaceae bacterium]